MSRSSPEKASSEGDGTPLWWQPHTVVLLLGLLTFTLAAAVVFGTGGLPGDGTTASSDGADRTDEAVTVEESDGTTDETDGNDAPADSDDASEDAPPDGADDDGEGETDDGSYTYSTTVEVVDGDGDPVEGVPVQFNPVGAEEREYTTDEDGEVTVAFDHPEPDDTVEYVLAVGEGERIVEVERGEQTEEVPLSESTAALYDDEADSSEETDDESAAVGP